MMFSINPGWKPSQRAKAFPFIMEGRGEVPAAAGIASRTVIAEATIEGNYRGYLLNYGVSVRTPGFDYSGNLGFSLLIGSTPYFSNRTGQWTAERGSVASPLPCFIQVEGRQKLTFSATRLINSAQPDTVDFICTGLFIPANQEPGVNCP